MADVHVTTYINLCYYIGENFVSISIETTHVWATDVSCQADILMATLSDMEKEQEALH